MRSMMSNLVILLILIGSAGPGLVFAVDAQVVAQDLPQLRVPGKVSAVVWTRRSDVYTLQIVLQTPPDYQHAAKVAVQRAAQGLAPAPPPTPVLPRVQAWLLKADGSVVSRTPGTPEFPVPMRGSDGVPLEVKYSFAQSAGEQAVAVAVMIDSVYSVQALRPFGN